MKGFKDYTKCRVGNKIRNKSVFEVKNWLLDVEVFGTLNSGDTLLNKASDEIKEATKVKITLKDGITETEKGTSVAKKG